jgi:acyl carrier protein
MSLCSFGGVRFPGERISRTVWLYVHFCLSPRDVEELLFVCGVIVSYEAIRQRCLKFGQQLADSRSRRRRTRYPDTAPSGERTPAHRDERCIQRFKSPGHGQRFLAACGPLAQHFRLRRYRLSTLTYCLTTLSRIGIRMMVLDRENLRRYLHEKQGLEPEDFEDDTLLFSSGLIDSFSMVDLIIFIEDTGGLRVHPADVTLDNFDSIDRILAFVETRCD